MTQTLPPGGKALQRRLQLELQRGIAPAAAPAAAAPPPPPPPPPPAARGWRPLGPFSIPHGQTKAGEGGPDPRPSVSGRVSAVAVDPGNASHVLVGAASGGIWETTDAGATWAARSDQQPSLYTGALAFDPSAPATVYAGTGEGDQGGGVNTGAGLLRSTDGGASWAPRDAGFFAGHGFFDVIVDPLNGQNLVAATTRGVFRSTDGGQNWTVGTVVGAPGTQRNVLTWSISMHPPVAANANSTQEVLAGASDGVWVSNDGGVTWAAVALPGPAPAFGWARLEVCHARSNGDVAYVFGAGYSNAAQTAYDAGHLYRRGAAAGAFAVNNVPANLQTGQSWYDWFAATAPDSPDVLYLGETALHRGTRNTGSGAWTWSRISPHTAAGSTSVHADQHAIAFAPGAPATLWVGNDGGIFRSTDAGATWVSLNKGLCITEFEYIVGHPQFDAWLIGGTQDNGTMRYEGSGVWFHVADGDGGDCAVNDASPSTCYHTYYNMGMERSRRGGSWGTWTGVGPTVPASYRSLFYPPVEASGRIVAQAGTSLFVSRDEGAHWQQLNLPAGSGRGTAISIESPTRIWVATENGNVFRTDLVGTTWQAVVPATVPAAAYISDILAVPGAPTQLWVTFSAPQPSPVVRSQDGGATWLPASNGLAANLSTHAVVADPANPPTVFAATDTGVWKTADLAATPWTQVGAGLPRAPVSDLVFHRGARVLRAATQARGVWELEVDAPADPAVQVYVRDNVVDTGRGTPSPSGVPNPFDVGSQAYWWECADVKVDVPPFLRPNLGDVDFELFEDDHGVAAAGLVHEKAQPGTTVRVYAQVHNRGYQQARNLSVRVFAAEASIGFRELPAGFWTGFPANAPAAGTPWQPVAAAAALPSLDPGRAAVVGFTWTLPAGAPDAHAFLVAVTAGNDALAATGLPIKDVVAGTTKVGVKNVVVVNPGTAAAPRVRFVKALVVPGAGAGNYSLHVGADSVALVPLAFLSTALAQVAEAASVTHAAVSAALTGELNGFLAGYPGLAAQLDLTHAYRLPARGPWLASVDLGAAAAEPVVLVVEAHPRRGRFSLLQNDAGGALTGGLTLVGL